MAAQKGPFDASIVNEQYYHGLLPREDIKQMLRTNGDFLVRTSEPNAGGNRAYVLSVMVYQEKEENGIKHYVIQNQGNKYSIEKYAFDTIKDMVDHHLNKGESISKKDDTVILKTPILRQGWELAHEDIQCTKKLGEGAFGEVHKGTLRLKSGHTVNVAVKLAKLEQLTKEQIKEIMREVRFPHPSLTCRRVSCATSTIRTSSSSMAWPPAKSHSWCSWSWWTAAPSTRTCRRWSTRWRRRSSTACSPAGASSTCTSRTSFTETLPRGTASTATTTSRSATLASRWKAPFTRWIRTNEYQSAGKCRILRRACRLSPETMRSFIYTQKTDVWSFGILCWEIFSNGQEPYPGMSPGEAFLKVKNDQYRLQLPDGVPSDVANLIVNKCWSENPNDRYSMTELAHKLELVTHMQRPQAGAKTESSGGITGPGGVASLGSGQPMPGVSTRVKGKKNKRTKF